jgi:hypothetical protein
MADYGDIGPGQTWIEQSLSLTFALLAQLFEVTLEVYLTCARLAPLPLVLVAFKTAGDDVTAA